MSNQEWERQKDETLKAYKAGFDNKYYNYVKLHPNKVARTIMKSLAYNGAGYYHWSENRSLSIEEIKSIQSFPDNFILQGKFVEQWGFIGNSVPPKMMYHIAKTIKENILN